MSTVTDLLETVTSGTTLRARDLHAAVKSDLAAAIDQGNINSTVLALMSHVGSALAHMDDFERCSMAAEHGVAISNLLRRTGGDSLDLLDDGVADGTISCLPGRFRIAHRREGMLFAGIEQPSVPAEGDAGETWIGPETGFAVIVNATGFEQITDTRSPLLRQMLGSGTVRASASRTGIALDGSFKAAPGVFVLGPLMAGHHHGRSAIWHVESVARIISLAPEVAGNIVADTLDRRAAADLMVST